MIVWYEILNFALLLWWFDIKYLILFLWYCMLVWCRILRISYSMLVWSRRLSFALLVCSYPFGTAGVWLFEQERQWNYQLIPSCEVKESSAQKVGMHICCIFHKGLRKTQCWIVCFWLISTGWKIYANYTQIHPALQQIPAHSTLELCLWWLALDKDITSHVGAS